MSIKSVTVATPSKSAEHDVKVKEWARAFIVNGIKGWELNPKPAFSFNRQICLSMGDWYGKKRIPIDVAPLNATVKLLERLAFTRVSVERKAGNVQYTMENPAGRTVTIAVAGTKILGKALVYYAEFDTDTKLD